MYREKIDTIFFVPNNIHSFSFELLLKYYYTWFFLDSSTNFKNWLLLRVKIKKYNKFSILQKRILCIINKYFKNDREHSTF